MSDLPSGIKGLRVVPADVLYYARLQSAKVKQSDQPARALRKVVHGDYRNIRTSLPPAPEGRYLRSLNIGCGVAGINVLLDQHYGGDVLHCLLDGDRADLSPDGGFRDRYPFQNAVFATFSLLQANGVDKGRIEYAIAAEREWGVPVPVIYDLILSLRSWGYHYPVETYMPAAYNALKPGGTLIIDIRRGQPESTQAEHWQDIEILDQDRKRIRYALIKPTQEQARVLAGRQGLPDHRQNPARSS